MNKEVKQWLIFIGSLILVSVIFGVVFWKMLYAFDGVDGSMFTEDGHRIVHHEPEPFSGTALFVGGQVVTGTSIGLKVSTPEPTSTPLAVSGNSVWIVHSDSDDTDIDATDVGE